MKTKNRMAERENIRDRARRLNSKIQALSDTIDAAIRKQGYDGNIIELTEDMIPEEKEMALFEGLLKEGYSENIAVKKAKETLVLMDRIFGKNKG